VTVYPPHVQLTGGKASTFSIPGVVHVFTLWWSIA